jgi:hypothetical protein
VLERSEGVRSRGKGRYQVNDVWVDVTKWMMGIVGSEFWLLDCCAARNFSSQSLTDRVGSPDAEGQAD